MAYDNQSVRTSAGTKFAQRDDLTMVYLGKESPESDRKNTRIIMNGRAMNSLVSEEPLKVINPRLL